MADLPDAAEVFVSLAQPPSGQADGQAADHPALAKTEAVRLAYQLLLGREPENEAIVNAQSDFSSAYDLRNRFMIGAEYEILQRYIRIAEAMYGHVEADVKADTGRFDSFIAADAELETRIREIVRADTVSDDLVRNEYTSFHTQRFFDQVRAVVAIRRKILTNVPRARVLEVGASPVTRMYAQVLDDIDLFTADLPAGNPPEEIAQRFGSKEHYYINLDTDALSTNHPQLVRQQFHIVLFCEVIEHVLASPQEMLADLLQLVAPGGVLIVTTPNGMSAHKLFEVVIGKKGNSIYRRNQRELHQDHHIHVREYTLREIREAVAACGARVLLQAVKNYYSDPVKDIVMTRFVSAGEVQVVFVAR